MKRFNVFYQPCYAKPAMACFDTETDMVAFLNATLWGRNGAEVFGVVEGYVMEMVPVEWAVSYKVRRTDPNYPPKDAEDTEEEINAQLSVSQEECRAVAETLVESLRVQVAEQVRMQAVKDGCDPSDVGPEVLAGMLKLATANQFTPPPGWKDMSDDAKREWLRKQREGEQS